MQLRINIHSNFHGKMSFFFCVLHRMNIHIKQELCWSLYMRGTAYIFKVSLPELIPPYGFYRAINNLICWFCLKGQIGVDQLETFLQRFLGEMFNSFWRYCRMQDHRHSDCIISFTLSMSTATLINL